MFLRARVVPIPDGLASAMIVVMSYRAPLPPNPIEGDLSVVPEVLDPVLVPLGFAAAQVGASGDSGQVIFCRGEWDSDDGGCVDLVLDLESGPEWRIVDVRYWGFESDRWHLDFDRNANLPEQLARLAETITDQLAE